jgi:hypothetical protein
MRRGSSHASAPGVSRNSPVAAESDGIGGLMIGSCFESRAHRREKRFAIRWQLCLAPRDRQAIIFSVSCNGPVHIIPSKKRNL